jgi:hypothetical protein
MARMSRIDEEAKVLALRHALQARGLDVRDFEIEEDSRSGISQLLGMAGGVLTVRRRSTGEIRVYASGPGSTWFAAILSDLDRGYFRAATPARSFHRRPEPARSAIWV